MHTEYLSERTGELKRELRLYRELFEFAPCGYVATGPDGLIHEASAEAARLLGIEAQSLRGRSLIEFVAAEEQSAFHTRLKRLVQPDTTKVMGWEMFIHPHGGPPIPAWVNIAAVRDRGRNLRALRWSITDFSEHTHAQQTLKRSRDELEDRVKERTAELEQANHALRQEIAERRRMEELLRTTKERLQFLLSAAPAVIYTCKPHGDYGATFISENVTTQLGYEPREFVEDSGFWASHIHPEDAQRVFSDVACLLETGHVLYEYRFLHKDGTYRWMRDEARLTRDENRDPLEIVGYWIDITERKRTEEALRESESRFQAFMDNSPAAAFMKDAEGRYVYGNRTEARALGTSLEGFRGKTDFDLFWYDIAQRLRENDARVLATGRPIEITETAPTADRSSSRWLVLKFPFTDAQGRRYVGGMAIDITERERAEQALREREEKLNSILGSLNDVVWSLSPKTYDLLYLSQAAERLYDHKLDEFSADKDLWLKLIHPDDRERVLGNLSEFLSKGTSELEYRIVRAGGEVRWVRDRGKVIYSTNGEMLRLDGIVTDITERVRAEAQLIESQRRLKALFENTQDAILLFDDEARLVDVNPAACALFGYDREQFLQLTVWDLLPIPDRQASRKRWRAFMAAGRSIGGYKTIVRSDRTTRFVERRAVANIVPGLHLSVIRDVTERRQAEEALRESASALRRLSAHMETVREEQNAKIAREVHDELGGTLTMLKLGLAALLEKMAEHEPLRPRLESVLNLADASVKTVKRISSALRPGLLDTLGLSATIRWHAEEFSRLTGIRVELQLPEYIRLSPERSTAVFRIVQEALTNVGRHAGATEVAIRARKAKGELLVEIADNGRGIVAVDLAKTNSFGILGIRERSQYLGGDLRIHGTSEQGTRLTLRLPLEGT
jgi:PAS domain S-box-containing protein